MTLAASSAVPAWAARTVYVGAGLFGLLNLAQSSVSIGTLAFQHLHLDIYRSLILALTPDAGAVVAGTLWVTCGGQLRTWGRNVCLGLVGGSVVGNAADVLAAAGLLSGSVLVPLAVVLTVAGPILALVMGHLVLLVKAAAVPRVRDVVTPRPVTAPVTPAVTPEPVTQPVTVAPVTPSRTVAAESVTPTVTQAVTPPTVTPPASVTTTSVTDDEDEGGSVTELRRDTAPRDETPKERARRLARERKQRQRERAAAERDTPDETRSA